MVHSNPEKFSVTDIVLSILLLNLLMRIFSMRPLLPVKRCIQIYRKILLNEEGHHLKTKAITPVQIIPELNVPMEIERNRQAIVAGGGPDKPLPWKRSANKKKQKASMVCGLAQDSTLFNSFPAKNFSWPKPGKRKNNV